MVGGERAVFDACQDMFNAMGANIFYIGPIGQGLAMKLVNNMLVQTHLVAICEALVMGVKAGLDPQTIYDVVRVSTGTSYGFETRVPRILERDFVAGGSVEISYKDQELETAFAKQLGVPVFTANVSQQVFQMARAAGLGNEDHGAIIKVFEQFAGIEVRRMT
jgi:3-hydroxyisobutyrate dehydrogenase-like beta-hydroxyacid dehydrogenase